jgi:nucleoside-diphosphate-sugar epimerase
MTVLITGVSGQVGSRFARRMRDRRLPFRVLVRTEEQAAPWWDRGGEVLLGDLREPGVAARAVERTSAVVHIAAAFRGVSDEEATAVNRDATIALAEAAVKEGVSRFVFASTGLVYGAGRGRPAAEDDEFLAPEGFGAYPTSKHEAEMALLAMPELGLRIVRLAYVYGEGDPHLAQALRWAGAWPAHQRMHLVHHADASLGLWLALQAEGVDGRIYNIADDAPLSAWELHEVNGAPYPGGVAQELADPWWGIMSTARARRELGFRPIYPSVWAAMDAGAL